MTSPGYSRTPPQDVNIQPVAITSIDVEARTAIGQTKKESTIIINTAYHVGAMQVTPSVGDQWYVTNIKGEWRLLSRIPLRTPDRKVAATQGQVQIGDVGPLELHGSKINIQAPTLNLNGTAYRDQDGNLQRQNADGTWTAITPAVQAVNSGQITDASILGKLLLTAPDVDTVLTILGLTVAGAGIDGGTSTSATVDPVISGGSVSGPTTNADLDGGTPFGTGDIIASGGAP